VRIYNYNRWLDRHYVTQTSPGDGQHVRHARKFDTTQTTHPNLHETIPLACDIKHIDLGVYDMMDMRAISSAVK
jgi:hypothetical protein